MDDDADGYSKLALRGRLYEALLRGRVTSDAFGGVVTIEALARHEGVTARTIKRRIARWHRELFTPRLLCDACTRWRRRRIGGRFCRHPDCDRARTRERVRALRARRRQTGG